jgi:hypothetical protein
MTRLGVTLYSVEADNPIVWDYTGNFDFLSTQYQLQWVRVQPSLEVAPDFLEFEVIASLGPVMATNLLWPSVYGAPGWWRILPDDERMKYLLRFVRQTARLTTWQYAIIGNELLSRQGLCPPVDGGFTVQEIAASIKAFRRQCPGVRVVLNQNHFNPRIFRHVWKLLDDLAGLGQRYDCLGWQGHYLGGLAPWQDDLFEASEQAIRKNRREIESAGLSLAITEADACISARPGEYGPPPELTTELMARQAEVFGRSAQLAADMGAELYTLWGLCDRFAWLANYYPTTGLDAWQAGHITAIQPKPAYDTINRTIDRS